MIARIILIISTTLAINAGEQLTTREILPDVLRTFIANADRSSSSEAVGLTFQVIKKQLGRLTLTSKGLKSFIESERFMQEIEGSLIQALCDAKERETSYNRKKPVIRVMISDKKKQQELYQVMHSVLDEHAAWFPYVAPMIAYRAVPSPLAEEWCAPLVNELEQQTYQVTKTMDYYYDHQEKQEYIPELVVKKMSAKGRYIAFCEVELSIKTKQ